jgi:hypothetical protein
MRKAISVAFFVSTAFYLLFAHFVGIGGCVDMRRRRAFGREHSMGVFDYPPSDGSA